MPLWLHVSPTVQGLPSSHGMTWVARSGLGTVVHVPLTQARTRQGASEPVGPGQTVPQALQLSGSSSRLTHLPASGLFASGQTTSPRGQTHWPAEQLPSAPVGQHERPQTSVLFGEQQNFSVLLVMSVRQSKP
jgi:hypothetical protein